MTDIIETHGQQGATMETADRRPCKASRLVDLDEDDAASCGIDTPNGMNENPHPNIEQSDPGKCSFLGNGQIPFS